MAAPGSSQQVIKQISAAAAKIDLLPPSQEVVEYLEISTSEPGNFVSQLMKVKEQIPSGRFQEMLELVRRPGVPKEIHEDVDAMFEQAKREDHSEFKGHCYDPMSPHAEILAFSQLQTFDKIIGTSKQKIKEEFVKIMVLGSLTGVLVEISKSWNFSFPWQLEQEIS